MNLSRLFAVIALRGRRGCRCPAAAPASTCSHTDIVFYTTDTTRLATELGASASACADYYLSITPTATGLPRGDTPVTTIHGLGPHFHAMAEIRLNAWTPYATTNGWYAAGVEVRHQMTLAGYDTSLGDTWAVNEVGEPSGTRRWALPSSRHGHGAARISATSSAGCTRASTERRIPGSCSPPIRSR